MSFLIYGSTGYTGNLIARQAVKRGLKPILAGRDVDKVGRQAAALGLEWRAFRLSNTAALDHALSDTGLVLLIAGPYTHTSQKVVEACLRTGAHYLDITGEIDVYETLAKQDGVARKRGVMLGTGMGFDVVPTDCLANHLQTRLPEATDLKLAIAFRGAPGVSHGTLKSGLGQLPRGLRVRRGGKLVQATSGGKSLVVDFGWGPRSCDLYGWGDVSTAWYSTGIPNIEDYTPANAASARMMKLARGNQRLFSWRLTQNLVSAFIRFMPNGTSAEKRQATRSYAWGQVSDPAGNRAAARLELMEAYEFTAQSTILAVEKLLAGGVKPGFQTPSMAFGPDFVLEIEGTSRTDLSV